MKTYKAFNKDLTCRGFQYAEGQEYEMEGPIKACNRGFHACERAVDVLSHYDAGSSVVHEVEQDGILDRDGEGTKVASSKIKIGARLEVASIVKATFEYNKEHCTEEHTDPKQASAGSYGAASAGESGAASAGSYGAASAGESGAAVSRGSAEVGKEGIAAARGNKVKVKGGLGSILVLAEENKDDFSIAAWKAFVIDGETYKADTWYKLVDGEIVEVKEDDQ